jgi:hypothetical protein
MRLTCRPAWLALILTLSLVPAATAQPEDPAHAELRALRSEVLESPPATSTGC